MAEQKGEEVQIRMKGRLLLALNFTPSPATMILDDVDKERYAHEIGAEHCTSLIET